MNSDSKNSPMNNPPHRPTRKLSVKRTRPGRSPRGLDEIAVEEPLEIRLRWIDHGHQNEQRVGTTMRTPGADFDLARGFLVAEGILGLTENPAGISHCTDGQAEEPLNVVTVTLKEGSNPNCNYLSIIQNNNIIGNIHHHPHIMLDQNHRCSDLVIYFEDKSAHLPFFFYVHPSHRFI